jgi:hypothetical protein
MRDAMDVEPSFSRTSMRVRSTTVSLRLGAAIQPLQTFQVSVVFAPKLKSAFIKLGNVLIGIKVIADS